MPRRRRLATKTVFLLALTAARSAAAQPPALTFDQAIAQARKANRSLVAERARLAQAQTNLELAWAALFPTVAAQGKYTRNNIEFRFAVPSDTGAGPPTVVLIQPRNQLDGVVSFNAPLLVPAAYLGLSAVKSTVEAADAGYATAEVSVLYAVGQAFYGAAIADEVLTARQSSVEVARATVGNAETRFAAGTVTKVDVDRASLALLRSEQAYREARFGHEQAYRALATLIQRPPDFRVVPAVAPGADIPEQDLEMALKLRPEFRALELGARAFSRQRQAYAWRWAPTLSAFGNARVFNYDTFARQRHAWAVGAQLDWLLFDGGVRDAQRHLAAAQAREAVARAEVLRDTIRDDLANARGLLDTKVHAHEAAERQVVLAQETLDLVRTQYENGTVAQLDLLQAQDGLTAAREALAQAHFELAVADLGLRRAAGTFPGR